MGNRLSSLFRGSRRSGSAPASFHSEVNVTASFRNDEVSLNETVSEAPLLEDLEEKKRDALCAPVRARPPEPGESKELTLLNIAGEEGSSFEFEIVGVASDWKLLDPAPDLLGYKYAQFVNGAKKTAVMLMLQIPLRQNVLAASLGGCVGGLNSLQRGEKYRTKRAMVLGVRFMAKTSVDLLQALYAFQEGHGYLQSNWSPSFRYSLRREAVEPRASGRITPGCGDGIHFFLDEAAAAKYWKGYGIDEFHCMITNYVTDPRGRRCMIASMKSGQKEKLQEAIPNIQEIQDQTESESSPHKLTDLPSYALLHVLFD